MFGDNQRLIDCMPANCALLDSDGAVLLVNQAWCRYGAANGQRDPLYGVGANYFEVCDRADGEDAEIAAMAARGLRAVAEGDSEFTLEYPCPGPDQEAWIQMRARHLLLGEQPCVFVMHTDISKREIALRTAEMRSRENELYRAMIDILPDCIFAKDLNGRFLAANTPTAVLMHAASPADLIGRTDFDFYPPAIAEGFLENERAFYDGGQPVTLEQIVPRPDGKRLVLMSLKTPLAGEGGRTIGYVGHNRDVTEERARETALREAHSQLEHQAEELRRLAGVAEQASQAKTEFLAAMSHEIRTPLTSVLGMTDLLALEQLTSAQARYVDAIQLSGRHLLGIINSILDFSRIEAGRMELELIDFSPVEVLEQVQAIMAPQAGERGLELRVVPEVGRSLVVHGDPTRLQQILINLVGNALKFTAEGLVTLAVRELPAAAGSTVLRFEVRDTGIGITPERQAELFLPFVQADSSTTRRYGGSGLGLAISSRLVEAMDGSIGVASEVDQGSLFWVEIPFALGDSLVAARRTTIAMAAIRPLRVLVVDDVAANRELLGVMLTRHHHTVVMAKDGAAAVELVAREEPDLVLMDIQMPVMDGLEATRRIRSSPGAMATVPIVALTANVMSRERQRYLEAGMDQCLIKPVSWPDLFSVLAGIAAGERRGKSEPTTDNRGYAQVSQVPSSIPLLDDTILQGMARSLPRRAFEQLLARGMDGASKSRQRLKLALGDPVELALEAHRLRGTAGSFGLARISAVAARIEERLTRDEDVTDLVDALDADLDATREAIEQLRVAAWPSPR